MGAAAAAHLQLRARRCRVLDPPFGHLWRVYVCTLVRLRGWLGAGGGARGHPTRARPTLSSPAFCERVVTPVATLLAISPSALWRHKRGGGRGVRGRPGAAAAAPVVRSADPGSPAARALGSGSPRLDVGSARHIFLGPGGRSAGCHSAGGLKRFGLSCQLYALEVVTGRQRGNRRNCDAPERPSTNVWARAAASGSRRAARCAPPKIPQLEMEQLQPP